MKITAGMLAFVSLATIHGRAVEGQREAISVLCAWFDRWRQDCPDGPWWPQWLTRGDLRAGHPGQAGPGWPSWCYGAAGISRALQLAAIAAGDPARQAAAEHALASCLTGPQLARVTSAGLCHGIAGIYQTAVRAAAASITPAIGSQLPGLAAALAVRAPGSERPALLTGRTGVRLALETARHGAPPRSGWDACLLLA